MRDLINYTLTFNLFVGVEDGPRDPRLALHEIEESVNHAIGEAVRPYELGGSKADGYNHLYGCVGDPMRGLDDDLFRLADQIVDARGDVGRIAEAASSLRQIAERMAGDDEDY